MTIKPLRTGTESVAIVGFSPSRGSAPFGDPTWELWICNRLGFVLEKEGETRWDRHMDPHDLDWTKQHFTPELFTEYVGWLRKDHGDRVIYHNNGPIDGAPNTVAFPFESIVWGLGRRYVTNVIAYQIGLALLLGARRIGLWGVDLRHDTEYGYERPCVEWCIGVAEGRGVEIVYPPGCALTNNDGLLPLYGVESKDDQLADVERMLTNRLADINKTMPVLNAKNEALLKDMYMGDGARIQTESFLNIVRQARRGGKLLDIEPIGVVTKA
jgi:hypothetical protein